MSKNPKEVKVRIQAKDFILLVACLKFVRNAKISSKEVMRRLDELIDYYDEIIYHQNQKNNA